MIEAQTDTARLVDGYTRRVYRCLLESSRLLLEQLGEGNLSRQEARGCLAQLTGKVAMELRRRRLENELEGVVGEVYKR